jgi:cysteine dioxygenase
MVGVVCVLFSVLPAVVCEDLAQRTPKVLGPFPAYSVIGSCRYNDAPCCEKAPMRALKSDRLLRLIPVHEFVSKLRKLPEADFSKVDTVLRFARTHPLDPQSLEPYLFWDRQHYTRNLIDKTRLYELIAICWEVGHASSIHNHRDQHCWMIVPIGRLLVQNYRVLFQDLAAGQCNIEKTDVVEMNPENPLAVNPREPVHKVYNPREFNQRAVSLHIYSHPFDTCDVYSEEQQTCGTIGLSYTSEYGVRKHAH